MKELAATPDNLYVLDDLDTKLSAGNRPLSQTEFNVIVIYFYCVSFVSNGSMSCLPRSWTMYPTPDDGRCRIQTLPVPQKQTLPSVLLLPPGHVLQIYAEADGKFLRGPPTGRECCLRQWSARQGIPGESRWYFLAAGVSFLAGQANVNDCITVTWGIHGGIHEAHGSQFLNCHHIWVNLNLFNFLWTDQGGLLPNVWLAGRNVKRKWRFRGQ